MAFSRYRVTDAYTLEELRREYQTQDAKGRIGLLERLYGDNTVPPGEIILMAVEDLDVNVRQWIARHGQCLERDSIERLKSDSDPFVRARLRENPTILTPSSDSIEWFRESNHFERLALVRNNDVSGTALIEKIFDGDDQELGLNLQDRKELILAYLTNDRAISESHKLEVGNFIDGLAMVMTRGHFSKLWELISKRPKADGNVQLQHSVYRYLVSDRKPHFFGKPAA